MTKDANVFGSLGVKLSAIPMYSAHLSYLEPAEKLIEASKAKDTKAAIEALGNLKMSCVMCHGGLKILGK